MMVSSESSEFERAAELIAQADALIIGGGAGMGGFGIAKLSG